VIGIVTDSAASLPPGFPALADVVVVPMLVDVDGRSYTDLELMAATDGRGACDAERSPGRGHHVVRTSGPSPGAFAEAIDRADHGHGVVVLTVSAKMSSTKEAATLGARLSAAPAEVLDTGTAAGAEALVVHAAAETAHAGGGLGDVVARAQLVSGRVRLVAQVGDLRPLVRGGRLPSPLARLGNAVGLRPIFEFRRGAIRILRPALSSTAARDALVSPWRATVQPGKRLHVSVSHGGDERAAQSVLDQIVREVPPATAFVSRFSPAMVSHTGTDVVGVAWWWEGDHNASVG
jgi:DegV family protein with EDD domain